jgi:hypothetical protein
LRFMFAAIEHNVEKLEISIDTPSLQSISIDRRIDLD